MSGYISAYDRDAPTPRAASEWVWEPDKPHAREDIVVDEVYWNGEEWWVLTRRRNPPGGAYWNSLDRFWEAVGGPPATPAPSEARDE